MVNPTNIEPDFTEADLEFVLSEVSPGAGDKQRLKQLIREDDDFRKAMVGDDKVFQRVMYDEEIILKVSPPLYFEVLLRQAHKELEGFTHTIERSGRESIPVFDTQEVVELLGRPSVLEYLARMLASFTRIQSYVVPRRVRRGIWRRISYNDMDIDSLLQFCATADEKHRLSFYKRIADVCLFISGMFPAYTFSNRRYPTTGQHQPLLRAQLRRSLEDYETEGRRFYGLAEKHPTARVLELSEVFGFLRQEFTSARKPLSFIATQYLHSRKHQMFGVEAQ